MVKVGSEFKHIFEEAQRHIEYWVEDLRLQFLDGILTLMEEKGLSQKSLAEVMGVSEAYISRIFNENLERNFTLKTLVELSRAVNAEIRISVVPKEEQTSDWKITKYVPDPLSYTTKDQTLRCDYEDLSDQFISQSDFATEDKAPEPNTDDCPKAA